MKISVAWLKEWVSFSQDLPSLSQLLTMAGLEVEAISPVAGDFTNVIVALVKKTQPHPKADKLTLCEVDTGSEILQIVCGATNVRPTLKVALAKVGAVLPHITIKEAKLRDELSQGMLCSAKELGLVENSSGILELPSDAPIGVDLRNYMELNDFILDISLTPNRGDCFSVLGIAREVSALTNNSLKEFANEISKSTHETTLKIKSEISEACPLYCGRVIKNINKNAQTPIWLSERLRRAGQRSIHPVVDVTNYVMLELGQPMHAFNLQKIVGDICVRFAKAGESLICLDEEERELSDSTLLIADSTKSLAIAGIIGGMETAVDTDTQDIFLESAFFQPRYIANTARQLKIITESSMRFERGVDSNLATRALHRATQLLLSIVGGEPGPVTTLCNTENIFSPPSLDFKIKRFAEIIGFSLEYELIEKYLYSLGMKITYKDEERLTLTPPPWRFDINAEEDLVEEIARLHGFEAIFAEKMIAPMRLGRVERIEELVKQFTYFFRDRAYHEAISYSFVNSKMQNLLFPSLPAVSLVNPISTDLDVMQLSLWPGLINVLQYNSNRQQTSIKLFASGVVFSPNKSERPVFAALLMGEAGAINWLGEKREFDFYDLKGDLEAFFTNQHYNVVFQETSHHSLHPGKAAIIKCAESFEPTVNNKDKMDTLGYCGVLHPELAKQLNLPSEVILTELFLDKLMQTRLTHLHSVSKFPSIRRDLSLLIDKSLSFADIKMVVENALMQKKAYKNWLKSCNVYDVYIGDKIEPHKKGLTISLILQEEERTLIDLEINEAVNVILEELKTKFAITLRD